MNALGFQQNLRKTFMSFVRKRYPYGNRLIMITVKAILHSQLGFLC